MEEQVKKTNAGKIIGIIAFIIAIISLLISIIPIIGTFGLFLGGPALLLAVIALIITNKNKGKKGLIITALIISVVATSISGFQLYVGLSAVSEIENIDLNLKDSLKVDLNSLEDELNSIEDESMDSLSATVNKMQNGLDSLPE